MAFVSRSNRELPAMSPHSLGPGSYLGQHSYKNSHSYAPFASTSSKQNQPKVPESPGPGSYNPVSEHARRKGVFFSGGPSKQSPKMPSPGPGSYFPYTLPNAVHSKPRLKRNRLKQDISPSIPSAQHCYGYRETPEGELVLNKLSPAPVKPKIISGLTDKGTEWHKSKSKRTEPQSKSTGPSVGPGTYVKTPSPTPYHRYFIKQGNLKPLYPTYESTITEPLHCERKPRKIIKKSDEFQCFGSRVSRFKTGEQSILGPGSYHSHSEFRKIKPSSIGFDSNEPRFGQTLSQAPGPGSYNHQIFKKLKGSFAVAENTHKTDTTPGPGHYFMRLKSNSEKEMAVFVSKSTRQNICNGNRVPTPGTYKINRNISDKQIKYQHPAFDAKEIRFVYKDDPGVGPGSYNVRSIKNSLSATILKGKRHSNGSIDSPGPGAYESNEKWVKKSYNVHFRRKK